jgi:hypothetical protein
MSQHTLSHAWADIVSGAPVVSYLTRIDNGVVTGRNDVVGLVSTGKGYRLVTSSAQLVVPR